MEQDIGSCPEAGMGLSQEQAVGGPTAYHTPSITVVLNF